VEVASWRASKSSEKWTTGELDMARPSECDRLPAMDFRFRSTFFLALTILTFSTRSAGAAVPDIAFEQFRLPNGLDVVLHADHRVPLVHVEVWYKVGSKDEVAGKTGFAHLFEHMMFQGTKHIPEDAYFKYLSQAGASARNGSTSTDRTNYFETLPASQLELGLWLESSRMGFLLDRPSFKESFANQRDVVKNERRQRVENAPLGAVSRLELETLFPAGHPYRHEVIGSMEDLDAASEADLKDFYNRYYAPGNAVLLIAGDIDTAITKGLIEKYFGPIAAGPAIQRVPVPAIPSPPAERRLAMEANINLPRGQMVWNTVPVFAPGDAEMDILANVLGEGRSSRLYQRLVHELKIAQSVSANHGSRMHGGSFEIDYSAMQGHTLAEIEKVIDDELDKLRAQPPTPEEIERARNQVKTDLLKGMEPLSGLATRLLYYDVFAGEPGYLRRDLERYDAATPEILGTWVKKILTKHARVVVTVEPNPKAPIMGRLIKAPAPAASKLAAVDGGVAQKAPTGKIASRTSPDAAFRASLPAPGVKVPFKVPPVKRLRLKNGLSVILAESHKLPLVSVDLILKTGGSANAKDKAGLANLTANMLDEGTKKRTAPQIASEVAQLGASLTTHATWDATAVSLSVLADNLERALPVWADVLLNPAFAQDDFDRVTDNLSSSLAQRKDYPPVVAGQVYSRALWGESHPFGWPDTGTQASIKKLGPADVKHFYDTFYVPNNAVLVVAGDITEKQVHAKLEPLLAAWKAKKVPPLRLPKVEAADKPRIVLVDKPGAPQSSIRIGLPGIERKNPDYYRALVTNMILGGGFKRLAMNLRETKGWTYGVGSQFDARRSIGPWTVSGEFVAAHTADAVEEIVKEIEKLRTEDVTDKELAETRDEIIGAFPARFATAGQLASQMTALAVYDLPPTELDGFVAKIAAVNKEQVRQTARKYFRPDNLLIVVVGDRASNEAALRKIAEVERRDLDGNLIETSK
jgi:zinc protease